jgi:hypothetical protein
MGQRDGHAGLAQLIGSAFVPHGPGNNEASDA